MDGRSPFYNSAGVFPMKLQHVQYYQQPSPGPSLPNSSAVASDSSGSPNLLEVEDAIVESAAFGTVQNKQ